jgi:hypothetical protein
VGKHLGTVIPPIGERAIALTCIVPGRFKAIGDTADQDGFGYHGRLALGSLEPVRPITVTLRAHHCAQLVVCKVPIAVLRSSSRTTFRRGIGANTFWQNRSVNRVTAG